MAAPCTARILARGPRRAAAVLLCAAAACRDPSSPGPATRDALAPVVARDAVAFAPGAPPDALVARLAAARLVLLGETHYVQEHQELLVALVARLQAAGFRTIVQEQQSALAWPGEEYAQLRSDALPTETAGFDRTLLEGLRTLNADLPEGDRVHFVGFDVNHSAAWAQESLALFGERFGPPGGIPELAPLLAASPDSPEYAAALAALPAALEASASSLTAAMGAERYAQLLDLVDVERRSLPYRSSGDGATREAVIRERILRVLSGAGTSSVAVNCGAFHAQKAHVAPPFEWTPVGTWLAAHPEAYGGDPATLLALMFLPARGELLDHYYDTAPYAFDAVRDAPANDLVRILGEQAGALDAWLPFDDPVFRGPVELDAGGRIAVAAPSPAFDGLVLYPSATVLESLALLR